MDPPGFIAFFHFAMARFMGTSQPEANSSDIASPMNP